MARNVALHRCRRNRVGPRATGTRHNFPANSERTGVAAQRQSLIRRFCAVTLGLMSRAFFFSEGVMDFPERLIEGYRKFRRGRLAAEQERYRMLAETGQHPEIMMVGCCDSRVSPEVIFDAGPGELFVVRNVANLVPPYSPSGLAHGVSAALEFAVEALRVRHIVVLGHACCGGIRAFATQEPPLSAGDFIGQWMSLIAPAAAAIGPSADRPLPEYLTRLEEA